MDSSGFRLLAKNFTNLTEEECAQLQQLARQHPYSQIIHLIHSRASQDLGHPDKAELLQKSAVYSSDRSVVKRVMTALREKRIAEPVQVKDADTFETFPRTKEDKIPATLAEVHLKVATVTPSIAIPDVSPRNESPEAISQPYYGSVANDLTGDALREDIYRELEKLKRLKHAFELTMDEFQRQHPLHPELDIKAKQRSSGSTTEPLLEEIKTVKKKLKMDNPKQKEQNEIIDQFIKTQPVIPKGKPAQPSGDLSEDSGIFSDNIVSETLVDVLLKQGKKDKAIEVLRKLIWKFPQKKAYFAAQIEDLKN